ncbi:hypothetical protein [Methylobacterium sp. D54C]
MPAPAIPPATPRPLATRAQAEAGLDADALMSPALVLALLQAQPGALFRAARARLPTAPDGLAPGEPWLDRDMIVFVPAP